MPHISTLDRPAFANVLLTMIKVTGIMLNSVCPLKMLRYIEYGILPLKKVKK